VVRTVIECNWVQSMEGHLDSSHAGILHEDWDPFGKGVAQDQVRFLRDAAGVTSEDDAPVLEVEDTTFGFHSVAIRDAEQGGKPVKFGRVHAFALPFVSMVPPGRSQAIEVPMDDERTSYIYALFDPDKAIDQKARRDYYGKPQLFSTYL